MPQLTTKFKLTIGSLLVLIAVLGLAFNQALLLKNQQTLNDRFTTLSRHVIGLENPSPTASPSATPVGPKTFFVPAKPVTVVPTVKK